MEEQLQQSLLSQLRDVHLPEAIGWWPLSIAWWLVIFSLAILLSYISFRIWRKFRKNKYRKIALVELKELYSRWLKTGKVEDYLQHANAVLKRCVLDFAPDAANFSGERWVNKLNLHSNRPLSEASQGVIIVSLYQVEPKVDVDLLHQEFCTWVKNHKPEAKNV